jgi:serine/threonine-protein kinase RsbW
MNTVVIAAPAEQAGDGTLREVSLCRIEELSPLLNEVAAALDRLGFTPTDCLGARLALGEAVVNGLRHGNACDPAKRVRVCYWVGPAALLAEVEDEGPGFDPASVPDSTALANLEKPSGRGLLLMRHYTTWLRFHGRGNRVTLCKVRRY